MNQNKDQHDSSPHQPLRPKRGRAKTALPREIQSEIVRLHAFYGSREIARLAGYSRKIVRRVLSEQGCLPPPERTGKASKLEPFGKTIEEKVTKGLMVSRILREIREQGYTGGRSILAEYVRTVRSKPALRPRKTVKRRFETRPGSEFDSLDDLNRRLKIWLDETPDAANQRIHGTTRLVPNQQWLSERQFLIQLPDKRFPVYDQSVRVVDKNSTLSIGGTRYTVPSSVAGRSVAVCLFAEHFDVLRRPPPCGLLPPLSVESVLLSSER